MLAHIELQAKMMDRNQNPWDMPEWHALGREASLVRHLVGSGATALGKANYADKMGEYYTAFFGLSVGLERLSKLILLADFAISNGGKMPKEKEIRNFGHKLIELADAVDTVVNKRDLVLRYKRPNTRISSKILECLDAFADARRGRYANFASLDDPNLSSEEPIKKWWNEVAEAVLVQYYYEKSPQTRVEANAAIIDLMVSPFTTVHYTDETGKHMQDVHSASIRTGQNEIVQKYSRYHALTIVRWLSDVLGEIGHIACYQYRINVFLGINEHFNTYIVDDSFLKTRKIWPLK